MAKVGAPNSNPDVQLESRVSHATTQKSVPRAESSRQEPKPKATVTPRTDVVTVSTAGRRDRHEASRPFAKNDRSELSTGLATKRMTKSAGQPGPNRSAAKLEKRKAEESHGREHATSAGTTAASALVETDVCTSGSQSASRAAWPAMGQNWSQFWPPFWMPPPPWWSQPMTTDRRVQPGWGWPWAPPEMHSEMCRGTPPAEAANQSGDTGRHGAVSNRIQDRKKQKRSRADEKSDDRI